MDSINVLKNSWGVQASYEPPRRKLPNPYWFVPGVLVMLVIVIAIYYLSAR